MKNFLERMVFVIGWLLSPFTFWNDAFVNIPIAYLCAVIFRKIFPLNFLLLVLIFYWMSNIVGLLLMYRSSKYLIGKNGLMELIKLVITMAAYSLILAFLHKTGILKPMAI